MEKQQLAQVLNVLVQAAELGQAKGAFALSDAGVIAQAAELAKKEVESLQEKAPMEVSEGKTESKSKK